MYHEQEKKLIPCDKLLPIFGLQTYLKVTAVCSNFDSNSGMEMLFALSKLIFQPLQKKPRRISTATAHRELIAGKFNKRVCQEGTKSRLCRFLVRRNVPTKRMPGQGK